MNRTLICLSFLLISFFLKGQNIYSKTFGSNEDEPILFIHGGPSGNASLFEATTAQRLSEKGFYVIVYDRRGEGRSVDSTAQFTYNEASNDIISILSFYEIKKINVIAHSFGGLVATLFAEKFPQKIKSLTLAGSLISQQETYDHILKSVEDIYFKIKDTLNLKRVFEIKKLNKNLAEYRKSCFDLAVENDFFRMPKPTKESESLRNDFEANFTQNNIRNQKAPMLFYKNETLKNIDIEARLKILKKQFKIFAIYGKQDNIFSDFQLKKLENIVGQNHFKVIDNCSHYLFVDQQQAFLNHLSKWIKN